MSGIELVIGAAIATFISVIFALAAYETGRAHQAHEMNSTNYYEEPDIENLGDFEHDDQAAQSIIN